MKTIVGPREERTHEASRRGEALTAANARFILTEMEAQVKSKKRCRQMAAFFATNPAGRMTTEAQAIYAA